MWACLLCYLVEVPFGHWTDEWKLASKSKLSLKLFDSDKKPEALKAWCITSILKGSTVRAIETANCCTFPHKTVPCVFTDIFVFLFTRLAGFSFFLKAFTPVNYKSSCEKRNKHSGRNGRRLRQLHAATLSKLLLGGWPVLDVWTAFAGHLKCALPAPERTQDTVPDECGSSF